MSDPKEIIDYLEGCGEDVLLLDPQEDFLPALIGYTDSWCGHERPTRAIYSAAAVIQVYIDRDGMSEEDACEFFEFNTTGAYVGVNTPIFLREP